MTIPEGEPFDFEGLTLEAVELGGHTPDNTMWVVRGQAVAHAVDLVHPGQAEFFGFGSADLREYRAALVAILGAEWDHLIAGHGALGRRADVVVALAYFDDVWDAVERVRSRHPAKDFPQPTTHTYAWIARRTAVVLADVREQLAVSWGGLPGFEVVIGSQVERMLVQQEYYD